MDSGEIDDVLRMQCGVISGRQVLACGGVDNDVQRMVRRHRWFRVVDGVYVTHNGLLTWEQQAWVAVLFHWPAALTGVSALVAHRLPVTASSRLRAADRASRWPPAEPVEVAIAGTRSASRQPGIILRRLADFDDVALMTLGPPRVRVEHAVLEVAARAADDAGAVAVISNAVQARRTTPDRLLALLRRRPRLRRRRWLLRLLDDVAQGAYSALEHAYLVDVERRHGLPRARRQRRERLERGVVFRDVEHERFGIIVELDGRLGHEWAEDGWSDIDRDIDAALGGRVTIRVRWRQVLRPCSLAAVVVRLLWSRGWTGTPRSCGPDCGVGRLLRDLGAISVGNPAESA